MSLTNCRFDSCFACKPICTESRIVCANYGTYMWIPCFFSLFEFRAASPIVPRRRFWFVRRWRSSARSCFWVVGKKCDHERPAATGGCVASRSCCAGVCSVGVFLFLLWQCVLLGVFLGRILIRNAFKIDTASSFSLLALAKHFRYVYLGALNQNPHFSVCAKFWTTL